ncbi:MAG: hypothetical protein ACFFC7_07090 [Candidatus Hermodarchaeota archaeon]
MKKTTTGIVFVVGVIELIIILLGIITIPFPQWLGNSQTDILTDELQQMVDIQSPDETMSQEEFQTQFIEQIQEQMSAQFAAAAQSNGYQANGNEIGQNDEIFTSQNNGNFEAQTTLIKSEAQATVGRVSSIPTTRTDKIVPISEWGCLEDWVVEQGYIEVVDGYIDYPLPIKLNNESLADWYLVFLSVGGYEPYGGVLYLFQKGEMYVIGVEWTWLGESECCGDYWLATFYVYEEICLDSSFYPYVDNWFKINDEGLIPDKEVDLVFVLDWTGCDPENNQDFTILSVRDKYEFS